ncbi:hemerythrin [Curvibacter sp. CHRR-16]|uniref:bacteriohemerythrin n=1 Tax=Curvibacter sp. CHRR-16 TaxID=2835872 RepID=UPI001BD9D95E|nr:hemerythrin domain-containing protein [Curvibacter sp. CHRR-16]MBT0571689.1 hemerythrin [Curvibacter sp. CHRR-16]
MSSATAIPPTSMPSTDRFPIAPWDEASLVQWPDMDAHHLHLVSLLERVPHTADDDLMPLWAHILHSTIEHFGDEDRWMQETDFPAQHCHMGQHALVLDMLREVEARGHGGDLEIVRHMAHELSNWLPQHIDMMDAGLALHLQRLQAGHAPDVDAHTCGSESSCG